MTEIKKDAILRQATLPREEQWAGVKRLMPMERELTLADIWLVIWKRKLVITLVAASTFLLGALYTFLKKPVYESAAQIQIDQPTGKPWLGGYHLPKALLRRFRQPLTDPG